MSVSSNTFVVPSVSIHFFRDIYIPAAGMRPDMAFDVNRQVWVWDYLEEDGTAHKLDLAKGGVGWRLSTDWVQTEHRLGAD